MIQQIINCGGRIGLDGLCNTCHQPAQTSSNLCGRLMHGQQLQQAAISGKLSDEEIWQWVKWLDKRCAFSEHQQDYIFFAIRQITNQKACASGAVDTVAEDRACDTCKHFKNKTPYPCGLCDDNYSMWEAPSDEQP